MIHYSIIFENKKGKHYGIRVIKEKCIHDITSNLEMIQNFVNICNKNELDYEHFEDVLENFLGDLESF